MKNYLTPLDDWLRAETRSLRKDAFEASQAAATEIASLGIQADGARDIVIRLRALAEHRSQDLADFKPMIEALTREVGLFPYVDDTIASYSDRIAARPSDRNQIRTYFHIEQQRIFKSLLEGKNVVASAPTSFGKSLIIDSMLGQSHIRRVAIIVPTLALLDETRRRVISKVGDDTTIVFDRSNWPPLPGADFIGTQERLLDRPDIGDLDLLIVDEFYKADPARSDSRFVALNAAISKLARVSKQFFLIGPIFIDGIDARGWRYADVDFIKTAYRTVSFDPIDVQSLQDDVGKLAVYLQNEANIPALVLLSHRSQRVSWRKD